MARMTGAEALVRTLRAEGVRHVFGIVGGKLAPLLHAISREPELRFFGVRHEAAAPLMAAAVNAGSGRMAVAVGEMGPGGLNLAAGIGTAANNHLPLLAVTSNQHRAAAYPHAGMFMDLDTLALFKPLVKWNAVVHDGRRIPELVRRAFREALQSPDVIDSLAKNGLQPVHQSPEEFAQLLRQDYQKWGAIQKATGFTAED